MAWGQRDEHPVIREGFHNDRYLPKPLSRRLFDVLGSSRVRSRIRHAPLPGGVREALKSERIQEVIDQHDGMIDIFILCVDRDGVPGRPAGLDQIEGELGSGRIFFAENAPRTSTPSPGVSKPRSEHCQARTTSTRREFQDGSRRSGFEPRLA